MESGAITNGQIRAFSEYDYKHAASQARLHLKASGDNAGCWSASRNGYNQWLQIDLKNNRTRVTRVATQGRASDRYDQWVTRYKLQYSENGNIFWYYRELGQTTNKVRQIFMRNISRGDARKCVLSNQVHTYMRSTLTQGLLLGK